MAIAGQARRDVPCLTSDDCKWGVMPFTDRQQKTRYALGLFLHPFGVEKPLLIGQLSSDVAEVFVQQFRTCIIIDTRTLGGWF